MAARPIEKALVRVIEDAGGEESLFERLASGETFQAIANTLMVPRPDGTILPISRSFLYQFLTRTSEGRRAYDLAMKESADAHVDAAINIADTADVKNPYAHTKVRNQMAARHWMAARLNRQQWGSDAPQVQINIGELHLDALRQRGGPQSLPKPVPQIEGGTIELADIEVMTSETPTDLTDSDPIDETVE